LKRTLMMTLLVALMLPDCTNSFAFLDRALIPTTDATTQGRQVFERICAQCHGANGEGDANALRAPSLNASGEAWRHSQRRIRRIIENGGRVMPPLRDQLSEAEIEAVIAYLRTLWTSEQLARHEAS
ncbi:MAG: cytochrome c, partial [Anaerolineae bacterium]|nr:cytochrome c [Anaerolineae bacterium]